MNFNYFENKISSINYAINQSIDINKNTQWDLSACET